MNLWMACTCNIKALESAYNIGNGGIIIQGRRNYCSKLKKGKLK